MRGVRVVYIAGPIKAPIGILREDNIRRAEAYAVEVWRAGAAALCPHSMARFTEGAVRDDSVWYEGDLEMLRRCDGVLMVPGWEQSRGARLEYLEAKKRGIPVFYSMGELKLWLAE